VYFAIHLFRHLKTKPDATYLLWWFIGVITYGMGTVSESVNTIFGWSELNFRVWYIVGALLGGFPLAQGTVYLLMKRRTAHILSAVFVTFILVASVCVMLTPVDPSLSADGRLTGSVMVWQWVRWFSPFINIYAFIFLFGGAVYSAIQYFRVTEMRNRFSGNILIAVGALLPGIGGSFTRMNYVEVLYVTELLGLLLIYGGYSIMKNDRSKSVHTVQQYSS
jgi:hypothetical protein